MFFFYEKRYKIVKIKIKNLMNIVVPTVTLQRQRQFVVQQSLQISNSNCSNWNF